MNWRIQPRQTGKSYDIAQIMKKDNKGICVQPTEIAKSCFCQIFDISKKRVFTINSIQHEGHKMDDKEVYIDEVGVCLTVLIGGKIIYGTDTPY